MDMAGEKLIAAPKEKVWAALNNTEILKASIPGCESLEAVAENDLQATAAIKLGPISARFSGRVKLSDIDAPNGYTLSGEGKGGAAGFAKGSAKVRLTEQADGTMLSYTVDAQVGGKIAQLGARLIDATAKSMADQFFTKFAAQVQAAPPQESSVPVAPGTPPDGSAQRPASGQAGSRWLVLAAVAAAVAAVAWFILR